MPLVFYVSHSQVVIDPAVSVPECSLSAIGRARLDAVAKEPWVAGLEAIMTSPERKARETAEILAASSGAPVIVVDASHEVDRSSTGYVPHDEHERLADLLFAHPEQSASGWERAVDAQLRIVAAVQGFVAAHSIAITGHGGVGTLLSCALRRIQPARSEDQPHGGCVFAWRPEANGLLFPWTPLENVAGALA